MYRKIYQYKYIGELQIECWKTIRWWKYSR